MLLEFAFRNQPLKALYYLVTTPILLLVRLPWWALLSAVPAWRPRKSWTFTRTLIRRFGIYGTRQYAYVGFKKPAGDAARDSKDPAKTGFAWVEPVSDELVVGEVREMARRNDVKPERVSGYWYGARNKEGKWDYKAEPGERVLYFIHGARRPASPLHSY
jgi:hypothetical protein